MLGNMYGNKAPAPASGLADMIGSASIDENGNVCLIVTRPLRIDGEYELRAVLTLLPSEFIGLMNDVAAFDREEVK